MWHVEFFQTLRDPLAQLGLNVGILSFNINLHGDSLQMT